MYGMDIWNVGMSSSHINTAERMLTHATQLFGISDVRESSSAHAVLHNGSADIPRNGFGEDPLRPVVRIYHLSLQTGFLAKLLGVIFCHFTPLSKRNK